MRERVPHSAQRAPRIIGGTHRNQPKVVQMIAERVVARKENEIGTKRIVRTRKHLQHRPARPGRVLRIADLQDMKRPVRTKTHFVRVHIRPFLVAGQTALQFSNGLGKAPQIPQTAAQIRVHIGPVLFDRREG